MVRILFFPASLQKATPPGARWITVHPNGKDSPGQPVLIQEQQHGSGVWHVIGGAGGKLNYLKLRGVKDSSKYREEAADRAKGRRDERRLQAQRDRELGVDKAKAEARERVRTQQRDHERQFIDTVAKAMDWEPAELQFDGAKAEGFSEKARRQAEDAHHRGLLQRARDAVDLQRRRLIADAEARDEAGLGGVAIDDESVSVADLDPVAPPSSGLGFAPDYGARARAAGLSDQDLRSELDAERERRRAAMTEAQRGGIVKRAEAAAAIKAEVRAIREQQPDLPAIGKRLVEAQKAVELLKAHKKLAAVQKKAAEAQRDITAATKVEPKAYVIEYTADPHLDEKVAEDLEADLRTARTRGFLSEVARAGGGEALGRHVAVGAFNSINSVALAVTGSAMLDRSAVDVLGVAGAAQALAHRLASDLAPDDYQRVADAMQDFHLQHYMDTSEAALQQAAELSDQIREIQLGDAADGHDLAAFQELNHRRREAIDESQRVLGQALGEMEANAALVVALKQGKRDSVQVSLGTASAEAAIKQVRALGLQRGDYSIDTVAGNRFLTVSGDGIGRLTQPVNPADMEQIRRNLDILNGGQDEDDWLPQGFARRPDLAVHVEPGAAPRLAQPFAPGTDIAQSVRDYIGGRTADGDPPADIVADLQSQAFFEKVTDRAAYRAALEQLAPMRGDDGKLRRAEALGPAFENMADEFVTARYGADRQPLHRQRIALDDVAADALHRALAATPEGTAAFKPIGDLHSQDQRALREFFYRNVAKEDPEAAELRQQAEELEAAEPAKESLDMFGLTSPNPEWQAWREKRDQIAERAGNASLNWGRYVEAMRGNESAYEAVQDLIRSRVVNDFAAAHNRLRPQAPVKVGRTVIRRNLDHLDAVDPAAREARQAKERALIDSLRERDQGRYAAGGVADKMDAARDREAAFAQSQMGFFAAEEPAEDAPPAPAADERHTLGHVAERQIAGLMQAVGTGFKPGQPLRIFAPSMSGPDNVARQRAIKLIGATKRVGLAAGVGSGKTAIGLGAFSDLHSKGKATRGLFLVPSIVQGQFGAEALRFLQPGKFRWHAEPGASREDRIAAYKDPAHHFAVMTHASFRDDMLHLGAQHAGIEPAAMSERVAAMSAPERRQWIRGIMQREGINFDYLMVDEGHDLLNRAGKKNSGMANVVDALSADTPYYVSATADPVKNDVTELADLAAKMDPDRYSDREAFVRRYGVDTAASKEALRRELARFLYPSRIVPKVRADKREVRVTLSESQQQALRELDQHVAKARVARLGGADAVESMRAIAPQAFEGQAEGEHARIARDLSSNLGILRQTAIHRIMNAHPASAKVDAVARLASERKGKPGVVFVHSLEAVKHITDRLQRDGHRVVALTGADSAEEKERKRQMFNPEAGDAQADILVASDAGATGMNVQRGQWLAQYDTPQTAKTHAQRQGRIFRTGQRNDVELLDLVADHPEEKRARARLARKYALRELLTTPLEGLDDTGFAYFLKQRQPQLEAA